MNGDEILKRLKRFNPPPGGGRYADPDGGEAILIRLKPRTLQSLQLLADHYTEEMGHEVYPMQVAAVLLEIAGEGIEEAYEQ